MRMFKQIEELNSRLGSKATTTSGTSLGTSNASPNFIKLNAIAIKFILQ